MAQSSRPARLGTLLTLTARFAFMPPVASEFTSIGVQLTRCL